MSDFVAILARAVVVLLALTAGLPASAQQSPPDQACAVPVFDPCTVPMRDGDQIWIVSSRGIETCSSIDLSELCCYQFANGCWQVDDWRALVEGHQQSSDLRTVLFLHGNRTDLDWSALRGLQVFDRVMGRDLDRPAIRFVIWSWPTDPQSRRVKEYRENSQRSVWEGKILAAFLRELGTNEPIGLIGYSFGAQAVVSATEAACQGAANEGQGGYQFRIACVAPAFQKPWSQVEDPFAGCAECVTSTLPIGNSVDRALRVHRCLSRIGGVNYACTTMVDDRSPWTAHQKFLDVGEFVGKRHDLMRYVTPPYVAEQIRTAVLDGERSVSSTR